MQKCFEESEWGKSAVEMTATKDRGMDLVPRNTSSVIWRCFGFRKEDGEEYVCCAGLAWS